MPCYILSTNALANDIESIIIIFIHSYSIKRPYHALANDIESIVTIFIHSYFILFTVRRPYE